jgi:hypothetical protein
MKAVQQQWPSGTTKPFVFSATVTRPYVFRACPLGPAAGPRNLMKIT